MLPVAAPRNRGTRLHGRGVVPSDIDARTGEDATGKGNVSQWEAGPDEDLPTLFHRVAWDPLRLRGRVAVSMENSRKQEEKKVPHPRDSRGSAVSSGACFACCSDSLASSIHWVVV